MNQTLPHAGMMLGQYTAESIALFTQMDAQPTATGKNAIDAAIRSLKSAGYWSRLDSLYVPKKANAQQSALIDWKRPTIDATLNGSATWVAANGFVGSLSANSYVDAKFIPSSDGVNFTADAGSMGMIIDTAYNDLSQKSYFGGYNGTAVYVNLDTTNATGYFHVTSLSAGGCTTPVAGFAVIARELANSMKAYQDGVQTGTSSSVSTAACTTTMYLLAINANGTASGLLPAKAAMWYAGDKFSGAEQIAIQAIFTTLFAALP